MAEKQQDLGKTPKLGKPQEGGQHEVDLVVNGLDGDQAALLELLNRDQMIITEQPVQGKTIADKGAKATVVPIIRK